MKQLLAILLIGISGFHFSCGDEATKHYNQGNAYARQRKYNLNNSNNVLFTFMC